MKIFLIYKFSKRNIGTVQMRTFQLKDILKENIRDYKIYSIPISNNFNIISGFVFKYLFHEGDVLIFNKDAIKCLGSKTLKFLRKLNCHILFDLLDGNTTEVDFTKFDTLICSSHRQYEYFRNLNLPNNIMFLQHHADLRLLRQRPVVASDNIVYVGERHNVYLPQESHGLVELLRYQQRLDEKLIGALLSAKAHYAVRPAAQTVRTSQFKPPTKIANAAACQKPIIINENADGAQELLGSSYPYLVRSDLKDANYIVEKVLAADPHTDIDYLNALKAMKSLRSYFSHETITDTLMKHIHLKQ